MEAAGLALRRVTLREDNRTIKHITMEVVFNAFGGHSGADLEKALAYQKEHGSLEGYEHFRPPVIYINDKAIKKIDFENGEKESDS